MNYKYRMHDPRIGRFFAVDPLAYSYPFNSPYSFSQNRLIDGVELEGAEFKYYGVLFEDNDGALHVSSTGEVEHSTWVHSVVEAMGGNLEAFEVYVLNYDGKGYMFTDKDELFAANSNDLEGRATKEGLDGIFMVTDGLGGAGAGRLASRLKKMSNPSKKNNSSSRGSKSKEVSTDGVNKSFTDKGRKAPYKPGTTTTERILKEDKGGFVRVHGRDNKAGSWIMREGDINGLSPKQIKDLYALPEIPTHISDVKLGKGTKVRDGIAAKVDDWGNGGGRQFQVLEGQNVTYTNTKKID